MKVKKTIYRGHTGHFSTPAIDYKFLSPGFADFISGNKHTSPGTTIPLSIHPSSGTWSLTRVRGLCSLSLHQQGEWWRHTHDRSPLHHRTNTQTNTFLRERDYQDILESETNLFLEITGALINIQIVYRETKHTIHTVQQTLLNKILQIRSIK